MPKAPILYRETFYAPLRGTRDAVTSENMIQALPFNRVETELGTMVETRNFALAPDMGSKFQNVDAVDVSISKISIMDDGTFQTQFGTGGGTCIDYTT